MTASDRQQLANIAAARPEPLRLTARVERFGADSTQGALSRWIAVAAPEAEPKVEPTLDPAQVSLNIEGPQHLARSQTVELRAELQGVDLTLHRILWHASPQVQFAAPESLPSGTQILIDRFPEGGLKIWGQIVDRRGATVGELEQITVDELALMRPPIVLSSTGPAAANTASPSGQGGSPAPRGPGDPPAAPAAPPSMPSQSPTPGTSDLANPPHVLRTILSTATTR